MDALNYLPPSPGLYINQPEHGGGKAADGAAA